MARTFVRQETQVRNSDVYTDNTAPSQAAYETNPTNIETDLNNVRSQLHNLLENMAGNWYDDLNVPATLETGAQRGVNDLNTGLHAVEKKRVLRSILLLDDVTVTASVAATGVLTLTGIPTANDTILTGTKTYTWTSPVGANDGDVLIGANASDSLDNLIKAIMLSGTPGVEYAAATTANGFLSAVAGAGDTMDATALAEGTQGNAIATTDPIDVGAVAGWAAVTLTAGAGGDVEILAAGELPTQTTAAVGVVTTLGTVVAYDATFGAAGLEEVAGTNALSPKNLSEIVDGSTGDPILTTGVGESPSGKRIWGLLQSEKVTDGYTITDSTPDRVQLSFVIANATNTDLVLVDGEEMGGKTINYAYRERVRLEDLNEQDFLNTAAIDIGAGAVTPTRQIGYDNQGITPVDVTTSSTLDLEGPGLVWKIRDDLEADLFVITEGSAGGTSVVQVSAGVDTFDVDAVLNDFLNGASFDTGAAGTTINIGTTANQIDSGGALTIASGGAGDLDLVAAAQLTFTDQWYAASTYDTDLVLADSSAEWDAFETEFGEVSLLNAIVQASNAGGITKTCANVTANVAADVDISNSDGNLDAALGDLSGGDFVGDHDVFLNGQLLRSGANAAANNDVYPGTDLDNASDGQLKYEFKLKTGDVVCIISRVSTA